MVTEGRVTEPQYVDQLDGLLRSHGTTTTVKTVIVGKDPLKVVQKCIEVRDTAIDKEKGYDTCVCLVDVDQHDSLPEAQRLAAEEDILLLISNLKFEVWLRWHVEAGRSALSSTQLDRMMKKRALVTGKNLAPHFPIDRVDSACETARRADPELAPGRKGPNPSTALPILVDLLRGSPR
ncbi:RloB family protein [Brachybacterium sp. DNPG3]